MDSGGAQLYPDTQFTIKGWIRDPDGNPYIFDPANDERSDRTSAESLASFVKQNGTASVASDAIKNGAVMFTDLVPGAYLVMQHEAAPGYEALSAFLAFLPQVSDSDLIYEVQARPKPVKRIRPGSIELAAQKEVAVISGTAPDNTIFSFVLTPQSPDAPLPENNKASYGSGNSSMTVSRTGPGPVSFGSLSFSKADIGSVYEYSVREVKGSAAHYTYDTTVYKLTIRILSADNGKTFSASAQYTDENGKKVSDIVFKNLYDSTENMPKLPQTGQLWWPIFVMVPGGILLIIIGVMCLRRGKAEEAEDAV